ncbi:uncharacterized protein LOC143209200 isoform X2 [Lasioglossum baleicum]|uniref:uncharacterized protein LOC143209200 isoform X2 n=1 Tax=Lasioglossum baleicum TaxID=434251 RepID=UPI003FCDDF64
MFNRNSTNNNIRETVETEVIKVLQEQDYTLNTVNSHGENLLHTSAANGCLNITKEILRKEYSSDIINRKNKFGWTPLMIAIRNRDIKTVKYLLGKNANVNDSTYLGMSVLGLAAAIDATMFQIVYEACPSALMNCMHDDITPLCIAAMKNDKRLFFQLLRLGFEVSKINEYTHIMMKLSTVPEIRNLAESNDVENYWNDTSDNILVESDSNQTKNLKEYDKENKNDDVMSALSSIVVPKTIVHTSEKYSEDCNNNVVMSSNQYSKGIPSNLNVVLKHSDSSLCSIISPRLTCILDEIVPGSPNIYFTNNNSNDKVNIRTMNNMKYEQLIQDKAEKLIQQSNHNESLPDRPLQRLQSIRPPDLNIQNDEEDDPNTTLGFIPEFSPVRSPYVPADLNDENVFGETTPTPPRYKTPPRGMILNSEETKMCILLQRHGLGQHIPIFLEQEVDFELLMSLTDQDLIEIGVTVNAERKAILDVITEYSYYY